jgi:CheY-like chemotaxis protein
MTQPNAARAGRARPAADPAVSRRPRPRVLVVEDHDETREVVAMLLKTEGYEVTLAADGDAGVAAARASHPQIAIVDIFLPRKDGVAVIDELVRDLPSVVIVAVSADGSEDRRGALIRAREAGAHLTLRKPLEPWVLLKAVEGAAAALSNGGLRQRAG